MADNNDKILPVVRWLLIAFFGLLLVLALQLFLLLARADATAKKCYCRVSLVTEEFIG